MKSLTRVWRFLLDRRLRTVPNGITLLRPLGTILFVLLALPPSPAAALWGRWRLCIVFLAMVATDIVDGWLARRLGQTSPVGRALDHSCDVLFILAALSTFVLRGMVPWWLPAAIAWAFVLYVVNTWGRPSAQPQPPRRRQQLGHIGGMLYYVTVGIVTVHVGTAEQWLPPSVLWGWFLAMALLAGVSGSGHLMQLWQRISPARRAGPRAENPPRSGH
jgi:phosphatidylglycerophosphate synthase